MQPADRENERYKDSDFCAFEIEEEIIMSWLTAIKKKREDSLKLFDVGCGSGIITRKMKDLGFTVRGTDFSEVALDKAKSRDLDVYLADVDAGLPEPDNTYDVVVAGDVLEHVFDPMFLLEESYRILKPGGTLMVTTPNNTSLLTRIQVACGQSYQEEMYKISGAYKHHTFFSKKLLTFMLHNAGFKHLDIHRVIKHGKLITYSSKLIPLILTNEFVVRTKKPT